MPSSSSTSNSRSMRKGSSRRPRPERTPSFVCELAVAATPRDTRVLTTRFDHAARQLYNACLGEALRRARRLRESRAYRTAQRQRGGKRRTRAFKKARQAVGFTDAAVQRYAIIVRRAAFGADLDAHVAQKLGSRAFATAHNHFLGRGGRPRFKGPRQLDSVEGKSNRAGILWREEHVEWRGLRLPARIDRRDPVVAHALGHPLKYVRLVRRTLAGKDRFLAQLVCRGRPYQKPQRHIGTAEVGLDLGPSTVAVVTDDRAVLVPLCEEVVRAHRRIRALQRHADRQRRATNPQHYLPDGRVKPGPKRWVISTHQQDTRDRLAALHAREAAHRKSVHGKLANDVLTMGKTIKLEQVSYRSYQRRFGRSVNLRAPGTFVAMLRRKAESAGGRVIEFPPQDTQLSQSCHHCGKVHKKPLSQRVHRCVCGIIMQRDLYSAFLAWCVGEDEVLHAGTARARWPGAEPLLRAAWSRATNPASGRLRPSSFGPSPSVRSQSGLPVEEGTANVEARDGVALRRESPGEAAVIALRTPGL